MSAHPVVEIEGEAEDEGVGARVEPPRHDHARADVRQSRKCCEGGALAGMIVHVLVYHWQHVDDAAPLREAELLEHAAEGAGLPAAGVRPPDAGGGEDGRVPRECLVACFLADREEGGLGVCNQSSRDGRGGLVVVVDYHGARRACVVPDHDAELYGESMKLGKGGIHGEQGRQALMDVWMCICSGY